LKQAKCQQNQATKLFTNYRCDGIDDIQMRIYTSIKMKKRNLSNLILVTEWLQIQSIRDTGVLRKPDIAVRHFLPARQSWCCTWLGQRKLADFLAPEKIEKQMQEQSITKVCGYHKRTILRTGTRSIPE